MIRLLWIIPFFIFCQGDELLSTRCQSQCLHLLEKKLQDNPEHRKNLKHHIMQMCKDDVTCSSCSLPCGEQKFEESRECNRLCNTAGNVQSCKESCDYLQTIYGEKPGACPNIRNESNYECTALCHLDGDCPETQKCCSAGCSRRCVRPRASDVKLIPVPKDITIQERKRKRSIIMRWSVGKLSRQQQNDNSVLYLVQWRWGLHVDEEKMTEWQTVAVRNKPYAILKHLLSPGRFYQFRVAGITFNGSNGFSTPSKPFKISKEAKAPPSPKDISMGGSKMGNTGLWTHIVTWNPPPSDLPIKNYQVSWSLSTPAEAETFEEIMRRKSIIEYPEKHHNHDEESDDWEIPSDRDRHSVIIPSHSTQAEITGLGANMVYVVEIHASVDSSDGELHGDKGIIFIRTSDKEIAQPMIAKIQQESEELRAVVEENKELVSVASDAMTPPESHLTVQTPFYDNELQTVLSWNSSPGCDIKKDYTIRVRKTLCREYQPNHHSDTRWHDLHVDQCSASLKGLSFDCDYKVEVSDSNTGDVIVNGVFATDSCEQTTSQAPIPCSTITTPIQCHVTSESSAHCHWNRHQDSMQTVIGYRILLSSSISHDTNTTINQPQYREVRYENLKPGYVYTVEVQSITDKGLGRTVHTQFITHTDLDNNMIERFPGGEIIELPLESGSSSKNFLFFNFIIFLLLRIFVL